MAEAAGGLVGGVLVGAGAGFALGMAGMWVDATISPDNEWTGLAGLVVGGAVGIGLGGLGIGESALSVLFALAGRPDGAPVFMLYRFGGFVWAVVGAITYVAIRSQAHRMSTSQVSPR
jgi:hypothetical protein